MVGSLLQVLCLFTSVPVPTLKLPESVGFSYNTQRFGTSNSGGLFVVDWCKKPNSPYIFWHLVLSWQSSLLCCLLVKAAPA